jgi:hypothetical protein
MNIKKNFEKNNFRVLKSDAKVDATLIFAATINTAPAVAKTTFENARRHNFVEPVRQGQ